MKTYTLIIALTGLVALGGCKDDGNDPQTIRETGYLSCAPDEDACPGALRCEDDRGRSECVGPEDADNDCMELSCACLGDFICGDRGCYHAEGFVYCGQEEWDGCRGLECGSSCNVCDPDDDGCNQPGTPTSCDADGECVTGSVVCEGDYDACADRECGEACAPCDPADPECAVPDQETRCNADGACVEGDIACAPAWEPCADKVCGDVCSPCDPEDPECPMADVETLCTDRGECVEGDVLCSEMVCEGDGDEPLTCVEGELCCVDRCCGGSEQCCAGIPIPPGEGLCMPAESACPISRRDAKTDIRYLSATDTERLAHQIRDIRLATYFYKGEPQDNPRRLGFIIDDEPGPHTVAADGSHVDLYGYTSLTVATLQVQARKIEILEAELEALRNEVKAIKRVQHVE